MEKDRRDVVDMEYPSTVDDPPKSGEIESKKLDRDDTQIISML